MQSYRELSAAELAFRPAPDAWSLLQVADHLVRAEASTLEAVRRRVDRLAERGRPDLLSRLRSRLLFAFLRWPVRVRMPGAVAEVVRPGEGLELGGMESRWKEVREGWRELLDELPAAATSAVFLRHPVGGAMDAAATLDFFAVHHDHHLAQVERLLAHPDLRRAAT